MQRLLLCCLFLVGSVLAGDWPTFRGDPQRSGIYLESLSVPLAKAWTYRPTHKPAPAWPGPAKINYAVMHELQPTLTFDRAFHVVADADAVYFGSSADDCVYCLDAVSGKRRWRFATEGPVRLPPVLSQGKLFAGSDDGHVYALDARTGKQLWTYRAGPEDQRLPGNGRMISLWPVRSGLIADGGKLYFSAGLFPSRGVFLCAVEQQTGKEVYKQPLNVTAQGTMLATAERLFVPTGRTAFWSYERKSGRAQIRYGSSDPWKKNLVGGSFALVADDVLATGPSEGGDFHWFNAAGKKPLLGSYGDCVVVGKGTVYVLGKGRLAAFNREAYLTVKKGHKRPAPLWNVDIGEMTTMLAAGEQIVTGGRAGIAIYDAKDGKKRWAAETKGKAEGLAISHGRLLVSLDDGRTICFKSGSTASAEVVAPTATDRPFTDDARIAQAAEAAIASAGTTKGYGLVLNAETGQLAWEIAKRTEMRVVCREADPKKVEAMREAFIKAGVYGKRIQVHQGDSASLPYPRYFANLIVSEAALKGASLPPVEQVLRVLHPCGGTVNIAAGADAGSRERLVAWGKTLPGWRVNDGPLVQGTARRGPLPGSGRWTHFYADPGNTACSGDEIRPGPMDLLWFGRPGPAEMVDRHKKGSSPLYANGRIFIPGFDYLAGVDAYNGYVLWERRLPNSVRVGAFKDSSFMAATDARVFVAVGNRCLVLDAQTGETVREIPVPDAQAEKAWGYLAVVDGLIIGSVASAKSSLRAMGKAEGTIIWRNDQPVVCSSSLFAIDTKTGKQVWTYKAKGGAIANPTMAIGNGRLYFIESMNGETLKSKDGRVRIRDLLGKRAHLRALKLGTGSPLWSNEVDLASITQMIFLSYTQETLVVSGSRYATVSPVETKGRAKPKQLKRVRYDLYAFDAAAGTRKWKSTATPSYDHVLDGDHGEQVQHPAIVGEVVYGPGFALELKTGKPYAGWKWQKSHKCGTVSMSRYCAFSRYHTAKLPYLFDLKTGKATPLTQVTRPGCWINMIPAGGLILIPEASAGCTCEYPIQTSLALVPAE